MNANPDRYRAPLIMTKLSAPRLRAGLVARPRLSDRLGESSAYALTLVCAPAGYGKTTLLTDWIAERNRARKPDAPAYCWLSLDEGDNEPFRYLGYLAAALETAASGISAEIQAMLESDSPPPLRTILSVWINDLEKLPTPVCLVLDDYQFISSEDIHDGMAFLLDHLPAHLHLVIATRSDPPIPLARLRARGQMMEIRADDLRFSFAEAGSLFHQAMGLDLASTDMARLEERTEGWIAGLQMAALALKGISQTAPSDMSSFVKNFSGSNRFILDYLAEEVLTHLAPDVQDFLLQTSILENLSGPLCDAVTGIRSWKSDAEPRSSRELLEYLERANLFVVSLDSDRLWYRYHHLFRDLLRVRLDQRAPEKVPELHRRAAEWYGQNQQLPEAVDHALDAKDYEQACRLIEVLVAQRMLSYNGMALLMGWIGRLPRESVLARPWLCIVQATSAMYLNAVDAIEPLLAAAEQAIRPGIHPDLHPMWKGHIACLRAFVADVHCDVPRTIEMALQALECLPPSDAATRTFAKYMLGRAYAIRGDFSEAIATLTENERECMDANVTNIIAPTLSLLSKVYRIEGRLRDSVERMSVGRAYVERCDPRRVTVGGLAFIGQANLLRERNELDEAEQIARRSLELCEPWANPSSTCGCYTLLARILQNQGKLPAAEEALLLAEDSIRGRTPLPEVICEWNAVRAGYWLATGQLSKASRLAKEIEPSLCLADGFSLSREEDEITIARIQFAEGKFDHALQALERLATASEAGGRIGHLIEIRKLQSLALQAKGDQAQAFEILETSLVPAEPEGYIRTFIDEGEPMRRVLLAYVTAGSGRHIPYAQKLLADFASFGPAAPSTAQSSSLVEPLTARETEILRAMAEGLSNHQIAEKLILAEGTVKFYVHAVLEKFGAHNRTQAVIEAKKQKII